MVKFGDKLSTLQGCKLESKALQIYGPIWYQDNYWYLINSQFSKQVSKTIHYELRLQTDEQVQDEQIIKDQLIYDIERL